MIEIERRNMLKTLTTNVRTWMCDDGEITLTAKDGERLKAFFMDGCFDAGLRYKYPSITKVVINVPATVVFWSDGTKTVVKCHDREVFDSEKGVAMAIAKKFLPKQYKRELKLMRNEALVKWADAKRKADDKLEKKKQKKETEKKACWNCKYKSVALYDLPCRNCCGTKDESKRWQEWVPAEKKGR